MKFPLISKPGNTLVAEPLMEIARAIDGEKLLSATTRLLAEAGAPTPVDTDVIAEGGVVGPDAPGPAKNPNVVFSLPEMLVAVLIFLPGELPTKFRFLNVSLFAVVTLVVFRAMRTTDVNVVVLVAVF
jgi:hypothetical protein